MAQESRPEPTLSVLDINTGQTITVTLENGGMETAGALIPNVEEVMKLATGNSNWQAGLSCVVMAPASG